MKLLFFSDPHCDLAAAGRLVELSPEATDDEPEPAE